MSAEADKMGPCIILRTEILEGVRPFINDERQAGKGLNIIDGGRTCIET